MVFPRLVWPMRLEQKARATGRNAGRKRYVLQIKKTIRRSELYSLRSKKFLFFHREMYGGSVNEWSIIDSLVDSNLRRIVKKKKKKESEI